MRFSSKCWRIRFSNETKRLVYASSLLASTRVNSIEFEDNDIFHSHLEVSINNVEIKLNSLLNNFFFLYIICRKIFLLLNLIFVLCLAEDIELYEVSDAAWKNYKSQYNKLYTVEEEPIRYFFYYFVYN